MRKSVFIVTIVFISTLFGLASVTRSKSTKYQKNIVTAKSQIHQIGINLAAVTPIVDFIIITETPIPTPTPKPTYTPTPSPKILSTSNIEEFFIRYANQYSISRDLLKKIAVCESRLNARATNGIYGGMFQFSSNSWITMRRMMNLPDHPDLRFDPEEAIKTASFKLSIGGVGAWPNCGK